MKVVSFINYKGGVGKTTLASNIAADLALRGKKVLCIDLDPQSNLTFSFYNVEDWINNLQNNMTIKKWYDDFVNRNKTDKISKYIVKPSKVNAIVNKNLDLICSHLGLINIDLELATMLVGASTKQQRNNFFNVYSHLRSELKDLKDLEDKYDVVIIDCPPNFNIITKNALVASDYYVVPAKPDYLSTLGFEELERNIVELVKEYNYNAELKGDYKYSKINPVSLGMISNMISVRNNEPISTQTYYIDQVKKSGRKVFETKIRDNKTIYAKAPEEGIPVVLNKPSDPTSKAVNEELKDLTEEFMKKVGV